MSEALNDKYARLQNLVLLGNHELVEKCVKDKDAAELRPMSRALGLACRYSDVTMVRILISAGASFGKRHVAHGSVRPSGNLWDAFERYEYFMAPWSPKDMKAGLLPNRHDLFIETDQIFVRTAGDAYMEILEAVIRAGRHVSFDPGEMLYWAILRNENAAEDALGCLGVTRISDSFRDVLGCRNGHHQASGYTMARRDILFDMVHEYPEDRERILEKVHEALREPIKIHRSEIMPWMLQEDVPILLAEHTTLAGALSKLGLLRMMVRDRNTGALAWFLEHDWIRSRNNFDALEEYARIHQSDNSEIVACILENRKRMFGDRRPPTAGLNPFSATALRRTWSTTQLEDGTLEITSYKGRTGPDVVIPARIGNRDVTAIDKDAFSRYGSWRGGTPEHILEARKNVESVVIPGSIRVVPKRLFINHPRLERVKIEEGVEIIEFEAFAGCRELCKVSVPDTVQIDPSAFARCPMIWPIPQNT